MKERAGIQEYDWWLLAIVAAICAMGVMEIYSATHNAHQVGTATYIKQLWWLVIGIACMLAISRIDYHSMLDKAPILYLIGILALLAVLVVGHTRLGAKRWLPMMGEFFQVSEIAKLIIIIVWRVFMRSAHRPPFDARLMKAGVSYRSTDRPDPAAAGSRNSHGAGARSGGRSLSGGYTMEARGSIASGGCIPGADRWHHLKPYQKDRVTTFLRPEEDPKRSGYQILQSKIAVGSGGFWGKGLGNGSQNQLGFVPVRYSDFILAALAEELGFAGVFVTLVLYTALLLRLIQNAQRAKDRAGMFLVMGVAAILGFHVLVNVAMVIGFMPVTGIPLPLMSYGGSAMLFVFLALGLVMNVRLRRFVN